MHWFHVLCLWPLLASVEPPSPPTTQYVQAFPRLNIRSLDADRRVLEAVGYGEALEVLESTGRLDTVNGLPGEWVHVLWRVDGQVHVEGQVFDAYLWPVASPSSNTGPTPPSDGSSSRPRSKRN